MGVLGSGDGDFDIYRSPSSVYGWTKNGSRMGAMQARTDEGNSNLFNGGSSSEPDASYPDISRRESEAQDFSEQKTILIPAVLWNKCKSDIIAVMQIDPVRRLKTPYMRSPELN